MMSKQSAIILILVVFFGALIALLWFYFTSNKLPATPISIVQTDVYDPFGTKTNSNNDVATSDTVPANEDKEVPATPNKLRKISDDPISGFSIFENPKTKQTDIHYILRANGNIYETYTNSPELRRLSITTIPKVYESLWLPDGNRLIIRYLKDATKKVETFSVKINPATTTLNTFEGGVDGNHLPENISTLAINPIGDKIFYLTNSLNGASGFVAQPNGLNKKLLFQSPLIEWLVSWPKENTITFTTKPTAGIPGYLYFLNSQTGAFSRVIGDIDGLVTKTNNLATEIIYSDSARKIPRLYLFNVKTAESKLLPWNTLPEKCTWGKLNKEIIYCAVPKTLPPGDYPDLWYQGIAHFTDDLWMINTKTETATLIFDIEKETNNNIDVLDLEIDQNDNYLFFTNKTDLTFWSLNLK